MQQALEAVECITERYTPYGYWWRYSAAKDEPEITLVAAIQIAASVAADEARKSGKTYLVATTPARSPDVYVFACDHPDARKLGLDTMYEVTPAGECIRHSVTRH
jgi:hypothetical protein